jgi:hypothetical protein
MGQRAGHGARWVAPGQPARLLHVAAAPGFPSPCPPGPRVTIAAPLTGGPACPPAAPPLGGTVHRHPRISQLLLLAPLSAVASLGFAAM